MPGMTRLADMKFQLLHLTQRTIAFQTYEVILISNKWDFGSHSGSIIMQCYFHNSLIKSGPFWVRLETTEGHSWLSEPFGYDDTNGQSIAQATVSF